MKKNKSDISDYKNIIKHIRPLSKGQCVKIHNALGDELRYDIWLKIAQEPGITGKELVINFKISQPSLSFHISQLISSGIVADVRDGQSHTYYPNFGVICSYRKSSFMRDEAMNKLMQDSYNELNQLKNKRK